MQRIPGRKNGGHSSVMNAGHIDTENKPGK